MPLEAAELSAEDIHHVRNYIENFWAKLIRENTKDTGTLIGLPNPYIVPADTEFFQEQYYWDSYPIVLALLKNKKHQDLVKGMVDNFLYLLERFGIVPNASRFYFLSRSQPPLLSSMVWAVFGVTNDFAWFRRAMKLVEYEYLNAWTCEVHPNHRKVYKGLSRYYDVNVSNELAEAESGWDNTCRFDNRCLDYLPVDLNCLLYKYEQDLARAYGLFGDFEKEEKYLAAARLRAKKINNLMWDEQQGYYFDFNFVKERRSRAITLAGIYPLVFGIAPKEYARKAASFIEKNLEVKYGAVNTEKFENGKQWDWPNGWALLELRTVEGLVRYGYLKQAQRIIEKWLSVNIKVFKETGMLWEKYDVIEGKTGVSDRYPTQPGFAWTNACFLLLVSKLEEIAREDAKQKADHIAFEPSTFGY